MAVSPPNKPDDDIKVLAATLLKQERLLNLSIAHQADQSILIFSLLPSCQKCKAVPGTVQHRHAGVLACDRCCATMIVDVSKRYVDAYVKNPHDDMNIVRLSIMDERDWPDVTNARRIRRLVEYVLLADEYDRQHDQKTYH